MISWENRCEAFILSLGGDDASHGPDHIRRVVAAAKRIGEHERASFPVLLPAAWLHDCVAVEKNSPDRARASVLSADRACEFLRDIEYPEEHLEGIHHAICAHSFSARIPPETIEARVLQDADRLDALGAIGLARCLMTGERMGLPLYNPEDPFAERREPDDRKFTIDHFYVKLFTLPETMQTDAGREEAQRRVRFLESYLVELGREIDAGEVVRSVLQ